jgi:hypothetical protein
VDGNHEHNNQCGIQDHNRQLRQELSKYQNISFLNRSAIVIDGVAFVGANGWWTFDFAEPEISRENVWHQMLTQGFTDILQSEILLTAKEDAQTLVNIIKNFDADPNIKDIVIVTHTAPMKRFNFCKPTAHPANVARSGSSLLTQCLQYDTNRKIRAWCFGHVHHEIDIEIAGVRYVCHPRGMPDEGREIYYPKLISI